MNHTPPKLDSKIIDVILRGLHGSGIDINRAKVIAEDISELLCIA